MNAAIPRTIKTNVDISRYSTLRVMATADLFAAPANETEVLEIFQYLKAEGLNWHILGGGSNLLLSSRGLNGVVISTLQMREIKQLSEVSFEFGAGLRMPRLCSEMTKHALAGSEFMEGIPGTVGGGVVMNAGAHGGWFNEIFESARLLNLKTLEIETWKEEDFDFVYRNSKLDPYKHLLISAIFNFEKDEKEVIRERVVHNNQARTSSQPIKEYTCGCTFKNPTGDKSAGQLIDEAGLKGYQHGQFKISATHANFFENINGEGTSIEMCELIAYVQKTIFDSTGIRLEPEVQRMGTFTAEENALWT